MENTTDTRILFARAVETAQSVIDAVRPDQLAASTPCAGMDVEALLGHVIMATQRAGLVARDGNPSAFSGPVTGLPAHEWAGAFAEAGRITIGQWADDALLTTDLVLPWMTAPGSAVLETYLAELTTHTWDLAVATGQEVAWDDETVAASMLAMERELPVADRTEMWAQFEASLDLDEPWEDPFGNATDPGADATPIERLVAWCGRDVASLVDGAQVS